MYDNDTTQDLQRAARKAARLHLSEYGHRDPAYLTAEVTQEVFCTYAAVVRRMAERPTVYGPTCQDSAGREAEGCEHESCPVWGEAKPAPVVLARWAARDALRDVLARDRHGKSVQADVRARLEAEHVAMITPGAQIMGTAKSGIRSAWHAEATTEASRLAWDRVAGDLTAFPTLAALIATASDSTRGGAAAWSRAAKIVAPQYAARQAHTVTQTRARREWATLTDALDTLRGTFCDGDVIGGPAPTRVGIHSKPSDGGPVNGATSGTPGTRSTAPLPRAYVPGPCAPAEPLGTTPYHVTADDLAAMDARARTADTLQALGWPSRLAYVGAYA